jgi:hypothetical protein
VLQAGRGANDTPLGRIGFGLVARSEQSPRRKISWSRDNARVLPNRVPASAGFVGLGYEGLDTSSRSPASYSSSSRRCPWRASQAPS